MVGPKFWSTKKKFFWFGLVKLLYRKNAHTDRHRFSKTLVFKKKNGPEIQFCKNQNHFSFSSFVKPIEEEEENWPID